MLPIAVRASTHVRLRLPHVLSEVAGVRLHWNAVATPVWIRKRIRVTAGDAEYHAGQGRYAPRDPV